MRRSQRLIAASVLIALSGALAGCSTGLSNFDPSDLLDFLDTKKKLPGERKPVFPDGVPGLEQGVPKELYKGSAQERLDQQNAQAAAAAAAAPAEEPKPKHREIQGQEQAARNGQHGRCAEPPQPPIPTPHPRKTAVPQRRRRLPSPRRSSATAPPRRRPISPPRSPRNRRSRRNNPPLHSRRRCRAAPSRARFSAFHRIDARYSIICAYFPQIVCNPRKLIAQQNRYTLLRNTRLKRARDR